MKAVLFSLVLSAVTAISVGAQVRIASHGKAQCVIVTQPSPIPSEQYAAQELAKWLGEITGATFDVREMSADAPADAIVVGPGSITAELLPDVAWSSLGKEESIVRTVGTRLVLAGGRPRGTLYAVYRFLHGPCGIRWWTAWAAHVPKRSELSVANLDLRSQPAFESRDPFWFPAFNGDWAARNFSNSQSASLDEKHGGKILYKGFVHTAFPLVPPETYFATHPEWYSLIDGKRTWQGAQLCTTNPELRDFIVQRVREWLKESPDASIVSISQNDQFGACQCPVCKAIDDREGSYSGTMLSLVNYVAEKLGPEFPNVAFDTLAYQYTRKAPKTIKPLPNVIVRLCSIECNFAAPLEDKSNAKFATDIVSWSKICNRLYIWDYTTDFGHYVMPHPNWYVLGPNLRFFHDHGVKGVFEQGAYQSFGSEMSELRAWLLSQLLYNPYLDDRKLIDEFLDGYYGKPSARYIRQYMALMTRAAKGFYMSCFTGPNTPYLRFATLSKAEKLWQQAEDAAKGDADRVWRVRQGRLPVWYVWLVRWSQLRKECLTTASEWPVPTSRKAVADQWLSVATGPGPTNWSRMTCVNEGGVTPEAFVAQLQVDPPDPVVKAAGPLPKRLADPAPPADLPGLDLKQCVDAQDNVARLYEEGELSEIAADPAASDGLAATMPGSHHEWAVQVPVAKLPAKAQTGTWKVYAVIRVEKAAGADPDAQAFTAGVYDGGEAVSRGEVGPRVSEVPDGYKSYLLGTVKMNKAQYVWVAPTGSPAVTAVCVDRVWLVKAG